MKKFPSVCIIFLIYLAQPLQSQTNVKLFSDYLPDVYLNEEDKLKDIEEDISRLAKVNPDLIYYYLHYLYCFTKQDIYDMMAAKYNFDPSDIEALSMWDTTEGMEFFTNFFMAFRIFLVGIGIATLITGGIGVSNIMNVVLEERTKEIGIKMALGAKKKFVMMQFLTETLILTFVGGIIGWLIGFGLIKVFPM